MGQECDGFETASPDTYFRTFLNAFIRLPAQIVKTGRRIVFRLLGWNRWQHVFLRGFRGLRSPALY